MSIIDQVAFSGTSTPKNKLLGSRCCEKWRWVPFGPSFFFGRISQKEPRKNPLEAPMISMNSLQDVGFLADLVWYLQISHRSLTSMNQGQNL